jgi:hypothetical protein
LGSKPAERPVSGGRGGTSEWDIFGCEWKFLFLIEIDA